MGCAVASPGLQVAALTLALLCSSVSILWRWLSGKDGDGLPDPSAESPSTLQEIAETSRIVVYFQVILHTESISCSCFGYSNILDADQNKQTNSELADCRDRANSAAVVWVVWNEQHLSAYLLQIILIKALLEVMYLFGCFISLYKFMCYCYFAKNAWINVIWLCLFLY